MNGQLITNYHQLGQSESKKSTRKYHKKENNDHD